MSRQENIIRPPILQAPNPDGAPINAQDQIEVIVNSILEREWPRIVHQLLTPVMDPQELGNQGINEDQLGNIAEMDRIPDVIKGLREFSSWRKSVERVLKHYDNLRVSPKYYGILNLIRNKIVGEADAALESYNTPLNWEQIRRCLTLHYSDKRDINTLEYQMSSLVQGSNRIQGFYQEVYHHLSLILDKISCMDMGPEATNIMVQKYRNKALDTFVRGLNGYLPHLLTMREPVDLPHALRLCLKQENVNYRINYAQSSSNAVRRIQDNTTPPIPPRQRNIQQAPIPAPQNLQPIPAPRNFQQIAPTPPPRYFFPSTSPMQPRFYPGPNYGQNFNWPYHPNQFNSNPRFYSTLRPQFPQWQLPPRPQNEPEPMDVDRSIHSMNINYQIRPQARSQLPPKRDNNQPIYYPAKQQRMHFTQDSNIDKEMLEYRGYRDQSLVDFVQASELGNDPYVEPEISECAAKGGECDETKGRPVCGTDKQTYPTRCHLIRAQCSGHQVSLKHRGSCRECAESRAYALSHRNSPPSKFVPRCRADGSFAPVQCMEGSGCWCSDSNGIPIPNTATRNGKPNCRRYGKSNIRRATNVSSRNKRGCSQLDQAVFNTNLVDVLQREFARYQGQQKLDDGARVQDDIVVGWKFTMLDTNKNNMLDKAEYREFKRLVKKVIKPKRCARSFGKFCDLDSDDKLSKSEWSKCLSKDGVSRAPPSFAGANKGDGHKNGVSSPTNNWLNINHGLVSDDFDGEEDDGSDQRSDDYEDEYDEDLLEEGSRIGMFGPGRHLNQPVTQYPPHLLRTNTTSDTSQMQSKSEGESDCLADRATALDEQQHGATALYVPECTADGRYQRIQCYKSTGYCWCVNEDTGQNIPGTSVKDKQPQCDSISRPMKGCPEPKKMEFLRDLKNFLKEKVAFSTANATKWNSEDEKIATLSFVFLDKNKNKFWERKEWKTFRELVTSSKSLKKCGKKMPRYCDVNGDKRITLSEWLNCLQAAPRAGTPQTVKPTLNTSEHPPTRKGNNPFETYLKSD